MPDGFVRRIRAARAGLVLSRLLAVLILATGCLSAAQITFLTTLVTPGSPGAAVWQNDYTLTGFSFVTNEDLQIMFDPTIFQTLSAGVANPTSDWDLLVLQPNPAQPFDGVYDLLARLDGPAFTGPFSIQYTLFGEAPPTVQPWQVVQLDSSFIPGPILDSGVADNPGIPEPGTIWLGIAGVCLVALGTARRRGRG
jgi:hypothetical protein